MQYIKIKDKEIPIVIKSYKTLKTVQIYFRKEILTITKPNSVSKSEIDKMIEEMKSEIYRQYNKIIRKKRREKKWYEKKFFLYEGEKYKIDIKNNKENNILMQINRQDKKIEIIMPRGIDKEYKTMYLNRLLKKILKEKTVEFLNERLVYWSQITNIKYTERKVRDEISKLGSCNCRRKSLNFNARLIMLPKAVIDSVIVHELCHIVHPDHSKDFYNLLEKYVPNYKEADKWLKENGKYILI